MRLPHRAPRRLTIPAEPFGGLALLLLTATAVAALYAVPRGVGLRFTPSPRDGVTATAAAESATALIVAVAAAGDVRFDGAAVTVEQLASVVRERLDHEPDARILLVVDPAAPYQAAIDAAAPLLQAGLLARQPLSIPNRRQVEALRANPALIEKLP